MVDPPYRTKNMMPGMIMLWHGSIATIPSGWALCDGNNGTPDLKGLFIQGAGTGPSWIPGSTGGVNQHQHSFTGDGHSHDLVSDVPFPDLSPTGDYGHHTSTDPASGDTDLTDGRPPYMLLCYIMKL